VRDALQVAVFWLILVAVGFALAGHVTLNHEFARWCWAVGIVLLVGGYPVWSEAPPPPAPPRDGTPRGPVKPFPEGHPLAPKPPTPAQEPSP
jgi:hypothetical protein